MRILQSLFIIRNYLREMQPNDIQNKRILISPLNWGMGHVARCIPLIDGLQKNGNIIVFAGDAEQQRIVCSYFPEIICTNHEGYPFKFGKNGNFGLDLAKQFRSLKKRLVLELSEVSSLVKTFEIDIVISDHRYGFKSDKVPSIFMTHQLNLPVKWFEGWVQKMHKNFLKSFDHIWVVDTENSDFAGELSRNHDFNAISYIGVLSRFSLYEKLSDNKLEEVVIVNGPNVYAEKFFEEQLQLANSIHQNKILIASSELCSKYSNASPQIMSSSDWLACDQQILRAKKITSRSGYSTLMDIFELRCQFSITPTPGQREQEYLFDFWYKKSLGSSSSQIQD